VSAVAFSLSLLFCSGLVDFLSGEKNFAEDRVRNGAVKLLKSRQATTQGRIDSFFKMSTSTSTSTPTSAMKRKALEDKNKSTGKKAKTGGGPPKRGK
jgi:flap endonuclease-1